MRKINVIDNLDLDNKAHALGLVLWFSENTISLEKITGEVILNVHHMNYTFMEEYLDRLIRLKAFL
jgi:hypothetical protein